MLIQDVKCKSILTKSKLPNIDYCCNLYIGCTHSCKYCYAKFIKRFTNHSKDEWGSFVDYKENCVNILKKEINKLPPDKTVLLGSITDSYQPIEKKLLLTRKCLELFLDYDTSISILTKSNLVLRDIDILKNFSNCSVGVSLGISSKNISKKLEPNASSIQERLKTLSELKKSGITTYAFIGPIIPDISCLDDIFDLIYPNVDFVMGEVLNTKFSDKKSFISIINTVCDKNYGEGILKKCKDENCCRELKLKFEFLCQKYNLKNEGFFIH